MYNLNNLKKTAVAFALVAVGLIGSTGAAHALHIDYNNPNNQPLPNATFNAYYNVPDIGDESNFVMLRKSSGDPRVPAIQNNFVDPVNDACAIGSKYDVRAYDHNSANTEFNDNGNGTAVAHGVTISLTAPLGTAGKRFVFGGKISSTNAGEVSDTGTLNCSSASNVMLKLVPHTVSIYTKHVGWIDGPDSAVNGSTKVGSRVAGSGDQWGCWDDRIIVVYTVEVVATPTPPAPVYTCDALTVERIGDLKKERNYKYTVNYTVKNGAVLKSVVYNFGDNTTPATVTTAPFSTTHVYAKDGTYKTTTDLTFTVNGQDKVVTDAKCAKDINTSVEVPCATNPSLPKDSPQCTVCEYNSNLPKDSKDCVKPTVPVTTIPSTGIGGIITGLLGSSAAGYGAYAYFESKKSLAKLIGRK